MRVADEYQVPPPVERSGERIQERGYESEFARLPKQETHERSEPGSGPYGSRETSGTNGPIVLIFIGALIAFSVFVFNSPWVLVLGLAIVVGSGIWAGIVNRQPGTMAGVGPSTMKAEDTQEHD